MKGIWHGRAVLHFDLDAFYPAVEVLDDPSLKGRPVIVGGSPQRGVVCSASYEARRFGVHSAQPMATARRLCPQGVFLPVRMWRYREMSQAVFGIFSRFTPLVEPLSIDEAFLDVTGSMRLCGGPVEIARVVKLLVRSETGLTVSAGVASSKFVAKIASDLEKPDGLTVVDPEGIQAFLDPLPIDKMWGVGEVTGRALACFNIRTFRDLRLTPRGTLERRFGKMGATMHRLAQGLDERPVETAHEVKSVGHEETFDRDIVERRDALRELLALSYEVARRLRRKGLSGRTITLKVKYSDFRQTTRSRTLSEDIDDGAQIYAWACRLTEKTSLGKVPVRLLGVSLSQLTARAEARQMSFFQMRPDPPKRKRLNAALDDICARFGPGGIAPGTLFGKDD